jgi:ubiquinone biosynthesis protein
MAGPPRTPRRPGRAARAVRLTLRGAQMGAAGLEAGLVFAVVLVGGAPASGGGRVPHAAGRALRRVCERLGATFVKIGQIASTRGDLLPSGVVEELARLRDRMPAFPLEAVRAALEEDLGADPGELFAHFEAEPVAAASVAQVHRARLPDGRVVAVKVRRPDIAANVARDRVLLLGLARALERVVPTLRLVALEEAMARFCSAVEEQLDLRREAANNARFTQAFADDPDVLFPVLHPALCSERVLTMDFVDGVHERELEGSDIDIRAVVRAGMRGVCRMIFSHGFVHADLHPGNMRFLPPGRVVLLDLGLVGELDDEDRLTTARMLFAFATGDGRGVARILYENSPHTATPDYAAYEEEVAGFVAGLVQRGLGSVHLAREIARLFDILRRHRVQSRSHMTMVNLALMTAEGLGKRLAPELSLTDEALPYLAEALGVAAPAAPGVAPGARKAGGG